MTDHPGKAALAAIMELADASTSHPVLEPMLVNHFHALRLFPSC
jgi:hypothetical protein